MMTRSNEMHQIIALFGANGNISSNVITHLKKLTLNASSLVRNREQRSSSLVNYSLRIITRNPELLRAEIFPFPTEIVVGSIDEPDRLDVLLQNVNRVFFCLPQHLSASDMLKCSHAFSNAAKRAGVDTVVRISSYGMDHKSASTGSQGSLGEAHIGGEIYMRDCGLTVTSIRPTSFFSNFSKYDAPSILSSGSFCSPLGSDASVNWISCDDISAVVAASLLNTSLDGRVLDITGPASNTLSAEEMRLLLQSKTGKAIVYTELPIPEYPEMKGLWLFLRSGGFNHSTDTFEDVTGRKPTEFSSFLDTLEL